MNEEMNLLINTEFIDANDSDNERDNNIDNDYCVNNQLIICEPDNSDIIISLDLRNLIPDHIKKTDKLIVVLDLDETLICARLYKFLIRNYACELIYDLKKLGVIIIVWSGGNKDHVESSLVKLNVFDDIDFIITREMYARTDNVEPKDLSIISEKMNNIILIDDNVKCLRCNVDNAILIPAFIGQSDDRVLIGVYNLLAIITKRLSQHTVPEILCQLCKQTSIIHGFNDCYEYR